MSEPKRRRIEPVVSILDLPEDILREIIKYDTTGMLSISCNRFRCAALATPCCIYIDESGKGFAQLSQMPRDVEPFEVTIVINPEIIEILERDVRAFKYTPRILRTANLTIRYRAWGYDTPAVCKDFAFRAAAVVRSIIDINSVNVLRITGPDARHLVMDIINPTTCKLRKLKIGAVDNDTISLLRIPIKLVVLETGWVHGIDVDATTFNSAIEVLHCGDYLLSVNGENLAASEEARVTFSKWYPAIRSLRIARSSTRSFSFTFIDNNNTHLPYSSMVPASRALVRGAVGGGFCSPPWEEEELRKAPRGISLLKWMYNTNSKVRRIKLKPESILRAAFFDKNGDLIDTEQKRDILRIQIPTTRKCSLKKWTTARLDGIFNPTADAYDVQKMVSEDLKSNLIGPRVARRIIHAACRSIKTTLREHGEFRHGGNFLRILPEGMLPREDAPFIALCNPETDIIYANGELRNDAFLEWIHGEHLDRWLEAADCYYDAKLKAEMKHTL